jgi:hypothetical protein
MEYAKFALRNSEGKNLEGSNQIAIPAPEKTRRKRHGTKKDTQAQDD